jgi:hypothetical protein
MFEFDATACGNGMARAAARVRARGGPGGKSSTGKPVVANMVAGPMIRDRRRIGTNRMFGDVFPQNVSAVIGDEFAFHDPDATASNNPQVGFGRLFFADGTLSTATGAGDLPVTRCGDHAGGAHRYQVIRLAPA